MPTTRRRFFLTSLASLVAGFAFLGIVVMASFALVTFQQEAQQGVENALDVESEIHGLFSTLQDAETGQRGFLLTGEESYLAPYHVAAGQIDRQFDQVAAKFRRNGVPVERLERLHKVMRDKLAELAATIDRKRAGDDAGALAIVRSSAGLSLMAQARDLVRLMQADQTAVLETRRVELDGARWRLRAIIVVAAILVALVALLTIWIAWRQTAAVLRSRDELKLANARLIDEAMQREKLEETLRQSQKMEAIGQLTGGLAHDFNNMLAIITGSVDVAQRRLKRGETAIEKYLDTAMEGASRAATLTHRLLAFSRQQPLQPQPVDANKLVAGMADLLRRTLGQHIHLETVLAGGLWRTHADPSQLENAILNLAVNARDAMGEGGRLTIETLNAALDDDYSAAHFEVPSGQYVLIAVSDTGAGMAPEVMRRAFDPFFTTKGPGKGTGLGLSQVFGFVKQSAGHVKIYSEVGQGTTMKVYLPRFVGPEASGEISPVGRTLPMASGGEVVLVVEDEDRVRQLSVESLKELGYTVLEADGASAALRIIDSRNDIALLFTDVVMPDVNGRKLADEAQRRRPGLRVLFTTGYTRNAIVHNGMLDHGTHLLSKPFTLDQLANKVREALTA
jgi:signal transduction histidine kinase